MFFDSLQHFTEFGFFQPVPSFSGLVWHQPLQVRTSELVNTGAILNQAPLVKFCKEQVATIYLKRLAPRHNRPHLCVADLNNSAIFSEVDTIPFRDSEQCVRFKNLFDSTCHNGRYPIALRCDVRALVRDSYDDGYI